jgi:cell division protein FtsQ
VKAAFMYKPPGMKKKNRLRTLLSGLAGWVRGFRVSLSKGKKSGPLAKHQRSWQLQKMARKVSLGVLALVLLSCCGWLSYSLLARSDFFLAAELIVRGNSMATKQQILEAGGLDRRVNLLGLDTGKTASLIREHPWVDQVTVKRNWPSTLEVMVREHKPLALVNLEGDDAGKLYYMDRKGILFAPHAPAMDLDYPVLTGESLAPFLHGMEFKEESLAGLAVEFLNLAAQGNQILPLQAVSEVHISREAGLIVYLVDHPFPIHMGSEEMKTRFYRLVQVLGHLYRQDKVKDIREIRMDYAENKILVANTGT